MTRFEARVKELVRQLDTSGHFRYLKARIELKKYALESRPAKTGGQEVKKI